MSQTLLTLLDELSFAEASLRGDPRRPEALRRLASIRDPDGVAARLHREALARPTRRRRAVDAYAPIPGDPQRNARWATRAASMLFDGDEDVDEHWSIFRAWGGLNITDLALREPDAALDVQRRVARWTGPLHFGEKRAGNAVRAMRSLAPPRAGHAVRARALLEPRLAALGASDVSDPAELLALASTAAGRDVIDGERPERFVASVCVTRAWWWSGPRFWVQVVHDQTADPYYDRSDSPPAYIVAKSVSLEAQLTYALGREDLSPELAEIVRGLISPP